MANKCSKCGADLSADAVFCPLCGTSKTAKPAQQPVQAQPAPVVPPPKTGGGLSGLQGFVDFIFSRLVITLAVLIGALLAWIGALLVTFSNYNTAGSFIGMTGLAGIGLILLCGGFLNNKFDKYIRLGMIVIGGYILVTAIISSSNPASGVTSSLSSLFGNIPGL